MTKDTCGRAATAIGELGDGELGVVKGLLLRHHARNCGSCASHLNRMKAVLEALSELGRVSAPEEFVETVMACLASGVPAGKVSARAERDNRNVFIYAGVAGLGLAFAVALGIVRWVVGREHEERLAPIGTA